MVNSYPVENESRLQLPQSGIYVVTKTEKAYWISEPLPFTRESIGYVRGLTRLTLELTVEGNRVRASHRGVYDNRNVALAEWNYAALNVMNGTPSAARLQSEFLPDKFLIDRVNSREPYSGKMPPPKPVQAEAPQFVDIGPRARLEDGGPYHIVKLLIIPPQNGNDAGTELAPKRLAASWLSRLHL